MLLRSSPHGFVTLNGELFPAGYPLIADACSTFADNIAYPAARTKLLRLLARTGSQHAVWKTELRDLENRLLKWIIPLMVAQTGLFAEIVQWLIA